MVLDDDQVGALRRYLRESPIDETTALMDDILEVGIGGHFLGCRSTRAHARGEVWRPAVFQRGTFEEATGTGRSLLEQAVARAEALLAAHEPLPLDEAAERELDAIVAGWAGRLAGR
jgi:trimethylamine--corrinoid protein Co-methyltransferase